jgi:hypothetical protein
MTDRKAWAHIAHRNGVWVGVISARLPDGVPQAQADKWKKTVAKDCGGWIADGWEIKTVYSAEEYQTVIDSMRMFDRAKDLPQAQGALL